MIFKLCSEADWAECQRDGRLPWSPVDLRDGFVHLSAAHQVHETAARHFRGREGLVVLAIDPAALPSGALRWEVSRGGERFPHLYGDLPRAAVAWWAAAPLDENDVPVVSVGGSEHEPPAS